MQAGENFALLSLLQRRADFARKSAASAKSPTVAKEFEELASLYDDVAGRAAADGQSPAAAKPMVSLADPKSDLVRHLQSRSHEFLMKARGLAGARADELKYLAGAFGAEAARLKNDGLR